MQVNLCSLFTIYTAEVKKKNLILMTTLFKFQSNFDKLVPEKKNLTIYNLRKHK